MKRSILLLIVSSLVVLVWAGTITKTFTFNQSELRIQKVSGYDLATLPNCLNNYEVGNPLLPIALYTVLIPANATVTDIEIVNKKSVEIPGEYLIYPVQPPRPFSVFGPVQFQEPNPLVYSSAEPYPQNLIGYSSTGNKGGYRLANFILYPIQYFPKQKKLLLHTNLEVKITYQEGTVTPPTLSKKQAEVLGKVVKTLILNPDDLEAFAPPKREGKQNDLEYVIITTDEYISAFQPLVDWRTKTGLKAEVKTLNWIYSNYTGIDQPTKIRNFIIDYFRNHGLLYVLLAGDVQIMPVRNARIYCSGYTDDAPCDWYFSDLDGSWDGNRNGLYGQRLPGNADSLDLYADVYVGRIPIDNTTHINGFLNKLFTYEKNPDPGYIKKILLPCVDLFTGYHGRLVEDSIANITPPGWQDSYIIDATNTNPFRDSINAGFHFCHPAAHGSVTSLGGSSGTIYTASVAAAQTNMTKPTIMNSIACDCGWFDNQECLAEAAFNNPNGGYIGVMMNARYGWGQPPSAGPSERLDIRFYDFIFNYDTFGLAPAHIRSKEFHRSLILTSDVWHYCALELNLFGDPAMMMWTDTPQNLFVDFPPVVPIGTSTFTVNVTSSGSPVANAMVCAMKSDEVYATGRTNFSGSVDLTITPLTPGALYITVTAHNFYPSEDSALARSTGAYVSHLRHSIDDIAGGNGDGIVNPGETIEMPTWVKNWGNLTAQNVLGKLTTSCPNVSLTDTLKNFGTIAAGDSAFTGTNGYNFTVAPTCTNGYLIPLRLICSDQNDSIWQSNINILVGTCILGYARRTIYDPAPGGNNNGRIDPGEVGDLVVVLRNTGLGNGYNVSATLKSGDSRLTVLDSVGSFGTIFRDTTGANETDRFTVLAANTIPQQTSIPCTLHITADGGYTVTRSFNLVIGEIRTIDPIPDGPRTPPLFWAYDNTDTLYTNCPIYEWVEIKNVGTRLNYPHNDDVSLVSLPPGFGPIKFYGNRYTSLSVSADGFVILGNDLTRRYVNYPLPSSQAPASIIAINWDDLYPNNSGSGGVYYYHDAANHRFIIEYDSVPYYNPRDIVDKFELIIYDTTVVTPNGDNLLVFQYQTANRYTSTTIGIQDPTQTIGIQYLYNGIYHQGAAPIAPNRAIKYITGEPITDIEKPETKELAKTNAFHLEPCNPNPFRSQTTFRYSLNRAGQTALRIYNATGRLVATLVQGFQNAGSYSVTWNGTDNLDKPIANGVYFYTLTSDQVTIVRKMLKIK